MKTVSHSKITMYQTCPKKFEYHYIKKIKDPITHSALLFGSALDQTVNTILNDKKQDKLDTCKNYQELFKNNWKQGIVNEQKVSVPRCVDIAYSESDVDYELIKTDIAKHKELLLKKRQHTQLRMDKNDVADMNEVFWECLLVKGQLMIKTFIIEFLPTVKEILAVQRKVTINNTDGDAVEGYVDFVVDFGEGPVICDLKTSSIKYDYHSASNSPQLTTYVNALKPEFKTNKTAFVVLYKQIVKNKIKVCEECFVSSTGRAMKCDNIVEGSRCNGQWTIDIDPAARMEVIHGFVSNSFEENVMENYSTILHAIREEIFPRNWGNCMAYNKLCPYFEACHKGKKID